MNEGTVQRLMEWDQIADDAEKETRPTIICGDFNTLDHGVAKLLMPKDPTQQQKGLGQKDSDFWEETEFSDSPKRAALEEGITKPRKKRYTDPNITPTFKIPGVFKGKLDYILLEKGKVSQRGNRIIPTKASDHDISTVRARID